MALEFQYSTKNPLHPVAYVAFGAMHTHIECIVTDINEQEARKLAEHVEREVRGMERRFNRFDSRSPLAVLNACARQESVVVDDELFMALELCEAFRRGTAGYFDIATSSSVDGMLSYTLDAKQHSVRYVHPDITLDMGGFAKGFALERVQTMVRDTAAGAALINFGNSSIAALGHHPYGEWWPVGVEHSRESGVMAYQVQLCDSAMSVSGRTPRGEYHIVNPHTGSTVASSELVVVEGRSALVAEVLSTALYAAPRSQRVEIIEQYAGYRATELYCGAGGSCRQQRVER